MDILKAEIEKKKRQLEEKAVLDPSKKYFKRGDLIKSLEKDYYEKQALKRKTNVVDEPGVSRDKSKEESLKESKDFILPRKEVIKRLREREEPILLFGETFDEAFGRLRKLEILEPEIDKGLRNDFQEALERVDRAYLNDILKTGVDGESESGRSTKEVQEAEEELSLEEIKKMAVGLGGKDINVNTNVVLSFLKLLLRIWDNTLNEKKESEKTTMKWKIDSATNGQTQSYIKPLLRKLKKKTLPEDIMESLVEIVGHLLDREYVKANDAYLQMAIGNAPWPIGVTMVGIHARTGREKIFSKHVAHVLNDETQRKYIQALKRLMTKCQYFFPTDPSKSVEYNA
ncbi:hypothetical protein CHUAL_003004 [Chamberlinius hualienensis]